MENPFSKIFSGTKDKDKEKLEQQISSKAWDISKKCAIGKMTNKDILELELLYNNYFKKYPNIKQEESSRDRIKKLKTMVK